MDLSIWMSSIFYLVEGMFFTMENMLLLDFKYEMKLYETCTDALNIGRKGFKVREQKGFDRQRSIGNLSHVHSWGSELVRSFE